MDYSLDLARPTPAARKPQRRDFVIFYGVLPLVWATWLAASGSRLIAEMPLWHGYAYIIIHCAAGWFSADAGCRLARRLLSSIRPALWKILVCGWLIMLLPMTAFYYWLTGMLMDYYPVMTPDVANAQFHWTADYPLKLIRGSLPWLCVWTVIVYGYRVVANVDWYGYGQWQPPAAAHASPPVAAVAEIPEFLRRSSTLPLDTRIQALQADEHYVRIWSDAGQDKVRYRFSDAVAEMPEAWGQQVHRSWWVDPERISRCHRDGHRMILTLDSGLKVPVSEAYWQSLGVRPQG